MFAPPATRSASSAYRQVGVETGVSTASAHHLVTMLFDGYADALAQARGAMQAGRVEDKGRAIGRAVRIVEEGLKAGLNLRDGGDVAANLDRLYGYVTLRLTEANLHNDPAALEECVQLIEPVRAAWQAIAPNGPGGPQ